MEMSARIPELSQSSFPSPLLFRSHQLARFRHKCFSGSVWSLTWNDIVLVTMHFCWTNMKKRWKKNWRGSYLIGWASVFSDSQSKRDLIWLTRPMALVWCLKWIILYIWTGKIKMPLKQSQWLVVKKINKNNSPRHNQMIVSQSF